ncbi:PIN domain-containing protein [Halorubrum sp. CSM-61]|uniref:PIN domain-containing protein n=1 Tax=Halorubrum sp. CSM-61 TaxID=2485838 RepID=UPI0024071E2B|nr:PIN domain-containing protein [Halorubrum sp. CSM-61]
MPPNLRCHVSSSSNTSRPTGGEGYPSAIELLYTPPSLFDRAVAVHRRETEHELSFTDAMMVAHVEHHDIDCVLSFDDDFDGVVTRLAPETLSS